MDNKEIYRKTIGFSLRRLLWDVLAFLFLAAVTGAGFLLAEKLTDKGLIGLAVGMILGCAAGYYGGVTDNIIMRTVDIIGAVPSILMGIAIVSALGVGTGNLMLAIGISSAPAYIRMMRGATISEKERMYVTAGRVTGCSDAWIMFKHILPNCLSPMIVTATMNLGGAIMAEASLSYLGLGIVPPTPAWGSMVSDGFSYIKSNPLLSIAPGVCIMIVVLAFNILGDGLRDMLDPRIRSSL